VKRLIVDARPLAGQAISVVAYAFDRGWSNQRQTGVAIDRLNVVVGNLPPTAEVGGPYVVDEGSSVEISGAASSDPEGDALTYSWDLDGDGAYDDAATAVFTHSFPDNGSYVVALRVADPEGATATATGWVTVLNVAPAASVTGPGVVNPVLGHASASVDVAFSDPGADAHEATIDCDNGGPPVQLGSTTSPFTHQCLYTTSAFGPRTVRVTVTDDDGGSSVVTHAVSVLYAWTGFFPPVASAPAENRAKAGSAIPLKFGLGGDQGLDVLASGSPSSRAASCAGQAIGEPFGASTPGASQLTYDPASQQYHYVWKSDKSWADTCRQISVQLADGTVHAAIIRFK
jgi:hypothetical protein